MLPFLFRRLASAIVTLALATGVVFIAIHLLPGDPVAIMLGDQAGSDPVAVARVRAQLGLDLPLSTQFTHWAGALAHGDLGVSLRTGEPVADELARRIPRSLEPVSYTHLRPALSRLRRRGSAATGRLSWVSASS